MISVTEQGLLNCSRDVLVLAKSEVVQFTEPSQMQTATHM